MRRNLYVLVVNVFNIYLSLINVIFVHCDAMHGYKRQQAQ